MAELLGTSFASVNRWENGQTRPSKMAWEALRQAEMKYRSQPVAPAAEHEPPGKGLDFQAAPEHVHLVAEAERLSFGHMFNPAFATETSLIDPLPHQRLAVYEHMLKQPRLRFLLADDAGAGKTIMTALYVREMLARRLLRRVLIVSPAGLVGNWERELRILFGLEFRIVRGQDARAANPFTDLDSGLVICSLDTLAREPLFARLAESGVAPYDLVVFDEAHKLAADRESDLTIRRTDRYQLAEALAGVPQAELRWALPWRAHHLLLLTATPHMGKDLPYYYLWRLLEPEVLSTVDAFNAFPAPARARHFLRRTKEEMVRFDGEPLYPRRESSTLAYDLGQGSLSEQALYDETTGYMEELYNRARILNRSAARLALSVFQRRLASSTYALMRSLERRLERLDELIRKLRLGEITREQIEAAQRRLDQLEDPFETTSADDDETVDGRERHELAEDELVGVIVGQSLAELEIERRRVEELLALARRVLAAGHESKFEKLREVLLDPRFRHEKLIVFTEHRDTLDWLTRRLEAMGFTDRVATLHGGMDYRRREQQVEFFRLGGAQYLVATDAAGEGINLQFSWLMVNYDIPWNPARLEQRMGRIHRYGQKHDPVVIVNLVAGKTREGRVLRTLLEKLEHIRRELRSDKVFDVVGRIFQNVRLSELMTRALSEPGADAATAEIEGILTAAQVTAIQTREKALYGGGGDVARELPRLRGQLGDEVYRRLLPGYVRQFIQRAAEALGIAIDGDPSDVFALRPRRLAGTEPLWVALEAYPAPLRQRLTVHRPANKDEAIYLHPGEAVFERLCALVRHRFASAARRGAVFVDPTATEPYLFHLAEVTAVRRTDLARSQPDVDEVVECRLVGVRHGRLDADSATGLVPCPVEHLLLLRGAEKPTPAAALFVAAAPEIVIRLGEHLTDTVAGPLASEARQRALDVVTAREDFIAAGFESHDAELASSRVRLAERARGGSVTARAALERVKEQQRTLAERRRHALAELYTEPERIVPGPVRLIAHALVVPSTDPEDRRRHDAEVEAIAVRVATAWEEARGATVRDVSTPARSRAAGLGDHPGFDLLAIDPDGTRRAIEVKGRARIGDIEMSGNEWAKACNLLDSYWLYAVFDCAAAVPQLCRVRNPFQALLATTRGGVIIDERRILSAAERETGRA
jgi:SNF2 family DNA or RNA helicase